MKIAIMGAGGLGSYLGGRMVQAGLDVTFIARGKQLQALVDNGLKVRSSHGDFVIDQLKATDNPADVGAVDLIFFCVKSYDASTAAQSIIPIVGNECTIIPVLNGIDHIELLSETVGSNHVLGGMALIVAHLIEPGIVEQLGPLHFLEIGEISGGVSERCKVLEQTLATTGIEIKAVPNIMERMWWKLSIVSGVAGVFSVVRGNNAVVTGVPETRDLLRQAFIEAISVAQASGVALSIELVDEFFQILEKASPHNKPSMLVDLEMGRRLELEAIIGTITRKGKECSVLTPVNDVIYACLKPYMNGTQ